MTPDHINELDEGRPTVADGNLFIVYLRQGAIDRARSELARLTVSYADPKHPTPKRSQWRLWCVKAREYLNAVPESENECEH